MEITQLADWSKVEIIFILAGQNAGHSNTANAFSTHLQTIPSLKTEHGSKQKDLCPYGSDQSLGNKGATPFAEHNIQSPYPNAPHSDHNHVVHQQSIVSAMSITKTESSSQHTFGKQQYKWLHLQSSNSHPSSCMRHDRGGEEATSTISRAFIELNTCNVALLEAADESWEDNFQQYYRVLPLGWTLSQTWPEKEMIWSMMGHQPTEQGSLKSCNNVEIKSKLNLVNANISNSSEEEPHDSKVAKKTHESIRQDTTSITTTTVERVSKVTDDVNTSGSVESPFEKKVKETENYGNKDHIAFVAAKEE
ncbi:histidine phosphatase superfamily protein [Tanacetum coccineum]